MAKTVRCKVQLEFVGSDLLSFLGTVSADEWNSQEYEVADGTSDEAVSLAGITTVDVLAMLSDQQITYKLNGSSDALTLDANKVALLFGTSITAMTISNASGSTAHFRVSMAGS